MASVTHSGRKFEDEDTGGPLRQSQVMRRVNRSQERGRKILKSVERTLHQVTAEMEQMHRAQKSMDYFLRGGREEPEPVSRDEMDGPDGLSKENFNQTSPAKLSMTRSLKNIAKNGRPPRPSMGGKPSGGGGGAESAQQAAKLPRYRMATDSYIQKVEGDIKRFSQMYPEYEQSGFLPSIRQRRGSHARDNSLPNRLDSSMERAIGAPASTMNANSVQNFRGGENTAREGTRRGRQAPVQKVSWMFMPPRNKSLEPKDNQNTEAPNAKAPARKARASAVQQDSRQDSDSPKENAAQRAQVTVPDVVQHQQQQPKGTKSRK